MPEYVVVAGVTAVGYLALVLRTWVRVRGIVQREKARGAFRRDVLRELPQGSRFVDEADQLTIEVGAEDRTQRRSV
ncbi:hypothetical protein EJ357_00535 [Streptomyces cyaneochromogenes]|uniref:Uncharacterized protein n=1 Tax=Streptomyces cyaneochromogenes TaxID=2496836 RepID=A0A3S5HT51_9ACTN|nr:hypothetical protein [Streptomyces cyaneochromogenes]AZQ32149.1 hypothetical protein EJ357_00535 [Streptomyces cyaneochromogenes]